MKSRESQGFIGTDLAQYYYRRSPAYKPPTFGLSGIDWAYLSMAPDEYYDRLARVRGLMTAMNAVEPMQRGKVSAQTLSDVLTSLYISFDAHRLPVGSLSELTRNPKAGPRIETMLKAGVFGTMPNATLAGSNPFTERAKLLAEDPAAIFFNSAKYQEMAEEVKDFLDGLNLLLVPHRYNPNRVSFTLVPLHREPVDERYIRFYEALTKLGVSSFFSVKGNHSVPDGFLGIYDRSAVVHASKPVFPQYSTVPALHQPENPIQEMAESQLNSVVLDSKGEVDQKATDVYHKITRELTAPALNFHYVRQLINQVSGKLAQEQMDFISLGLTNYIFDNISRGQLLDLEGLEDIIGFLPENFEFHPEIANKIRSLTDCLETQSYVITNILLSVDRQGVANSWINTLAVQSDSDNVTQGGIYSQQRMMARLVEYVQGKLPGIAVDEETVFEIKRYGEIIQLMLGRNVYLEEERVQPKLAASLTVFCETLIGRKLPLLRKAIPHKALLLLEPGKPQLDN